MASFDRPHSAKLEDQAATAALKAERKSNPASTYPLDEHHKLSAAGAATSLKYASPKELPSYPVLGLTDKRSSAGAAAVLANAHRKPFEHWKPDPSSSASAAAMLAKDYKMAEMWHPEQNTHGSRAAVLAAKGGANVKVWKPGSTAYGHSAAVQAALAADNLSPQLDYGYTAEGHQRSLKASTLAMSGSRRRSGSSPALPVTHADSVDAGHKAFSAANLAHSASVRKLDAALVYEDLPPSVSASRIQNVKGNIPREMFSSHPPLSKDVEEKKRQEALHSAAVSMAKQMYNIQAKIASDAATGGSAGSEYDPGMMPVTNLEEAAKKLAAERLAKLYDEHAAYREYYGTNAPTHRSSLRGRARRRTSSMSQLADEDDARASRIRAEMSLFNKNIEQVDTKKRQKDREALLAAAQKNVRASMHGLDEKVFAQTGRVPSSMMEEWEAKAHAAAEAESKARMVNYGKVNIGGGKYVDQDEVNAVASRNVQPLLDDINEKAELHRARQEEARVDREMARRRAEDDKAREKEWKIEFKKIRDQDKQAERAKKQEEKARRAEEKRRAKEERRRAKEAAKTAGAGGAAAGISTDTEGESSTAARRQHSSTTGTSEVETDASENLQILAQQDRVVAETTTVVATVTTTVTAPATAPSEPTNATATEKPAKLDTKATVPETKDSTTSPRVVSWIKDKFSRRASKSQKADEPRPKVDEPNANVLAAGNNNISSNSHEHPPAPAAAEHAIPPQQDVATEDHPDIAQPVIVSQAPPKNEDDEEEANDNMRLSRSRQRSPSPPLVSPVSDDEDDDDAAHDADREDNGAGSSAAGPGAMPPGKPHDQTLDVLDHPPPVEDNNTTTTTSINTTSPSTLIPPPAPTTYSKRTSDSPVRDSKFLEDL